LIRRRPTRGETGDDEMENSCSQAAAEECRGEGEEEGRKGKKEIRSES